LFDEGFVGVKDEEKRLRVVDGHLMGARSSREGSNDLNTGED
jgi:hypothetical protein